jgi:hypothetical protein
MTAREKMKERGFVLYSTQDQYLYKIAGKFGAADVVAFAKERSSVAETYP